MEEFASLFTAVLIAGIAYAIVAAIPDLDLPDLHKAALVIPTGVVAVLLLLSTQAPAP